MSSNALDEFFATQIPDKLWHYTNFNALCGILSSGTLWATDARHTNDRSEILHAQEIVEAHLKTQADNDAQFARHWQDLLKMLKDAFSEGPLSQEQHEVFILSFTPNGDQLPQWSLYGDGGRGVAIGFDLRHFRPPTEIGSAITSAPCIYQESEKRELLDCVLKPFVHKVSELFRRSEDKLWIAGEINTWKMIQRIYNLPPDREGFDSRLNNFLRVELYRAWHKTLFDVLRYASHCKNGKFESEGEWRLALPIRRGRPMQHHTIRHRENGKIPYIAFDFFRKGALLPIAAIRVGPLFDKREELDNVLKQYGYAVPVIASEIPLVDPKR